MLTIRELRAMRASMTLEDFRQQLGPFVLVRKPADAIEAAAAMELAAKGTMLMPRRRAADGVSLLFEFEDLEIATLPPVSAEEVLTVGRLPDNDVVIDHTSVSKRHAEVRWKDGRCLVVDLHSTNGTLVNDARVETREELKDSDIVTFGEVRFCFLLTPSLYRFMAKPPTLRKPSGNEPIVSSSAATKPVSPLPPDALLGAAHQPTPRRGNPPPPPPSSTPAQSLPAIVHRRPESAPAQPPPVLRPQPGAGGTPPPGPVPPALSTPSRAPARVSITPAPPLSSAVLGARVEAETSAQQAPIAPPVNAAGNAVASRTASADRLPRSTTPAPIGSARTASGDRQPRSPTPAPVSSARTASGDRQPRSPTPAPVSSARTASGDRQPRAEAPTTPHPMTPALTPKPFLPPRRWNESDDADEREPTVTAAFQKRPERSDERAEPTPEADDVAGEPTQIRDLGAHREDTARLAPEPSTQPARPEGISNKTVFDRPRSKQRGPRKKR